jgi:hypothetical protein
LGLLDLVGRVADNIYLVPPRRLSPIILGERKANV